MPKEVELEEPEAPKRGRPRKVTEDVIFGDDIDNDEEKRLREEQEISRMLEREDATTTTIIVSRRPNRTQRYAHLSEIGINDYDREEIARQYGGGEYRCRVRRSDGQFGATWYFQVDPSRKAEVTADSLGTAGGIDAVRLVETVASKLAPKEDNKVNEMMQMMMSKSDDLFKMMMVMQQENTKLLMTALTSRPQENNNSALQQISTTLLQHSLQSSKTSMDDMLGTIIKLKKLSEDGGRGSDEDDEPKGSFVQDIMSAIPQVLKSFTGGGQQAQPQPLPPTAPVTVAPAQTGQPAMPKLPAGLDPQAFAMVIMNLVQFASVGSEPLDVHNSYQPMLTDEMYDQIADFLENTPTWFEDICTIVPDAKPHKDWFMNLRDVILEEPEEEVAEEVPVEVEAPKAKAKKTKD